MVPRSLIDQLLEDEVKKGFIEMNENDRRRTDKCRLLFRENGD